MRERVNASVQKLLASCPVSPEDAEQPSILWSMHYISRGLSPVHVFARDTTTGGSDMASAAKQASNNLTPTPKLAGVLAFPPPSLDLAFDDSVIDHVMSAWRQIMGDEADDATFMRFERRESEFDE